MNDHIGFEIAGFRLVLALAAVLAIGSAACRSNGSSSSPGSADRPPWGLDTIELPNNAASVEAVFGAMPKRVDGVSRLQANSNEVEYEGATLIRAIDLSSKTDLPATSALRYLRMLSGSGEIAVEDQALDEHSKVAYVIANTTANGNRVYVASWGAPLSSWIFSAVGHTPGTRTALIQAFVEASLSG